jgi:hypothetical protein
MLYCLLREVLKGHNQMFDFRQVTLGGYSQVGREW